MTQIRIDTEHVREAGQRFIGEGKRLTEVGHELQNAARGLDLWAWDGHSRRQADSLLVRMRPENAYLAAKLESMGHRLLLVADVFEQRDRETESDFSKIPWVDFETAHRLNITHRTNLNPVAGTMLCAATLSELPMTGESSGGLVEAIYRTVPIETKVTPLCLPTPGGTTLSSNLRDRQT